ncbi:hypothetical protein HD553DRAFT_272871 [Filobasidium floriforme]|uniref:uncharacterized protein n=1 Tax=Filobasidium floriforme TaxID=5210 RepID=UPI001E8E7DB2|nr:uncharacterized protein HD553DRAFT_272871 [Filobasidium floriforme]KAH8084115.1 hypothetical protein HD553DRAFT_272871 [Filobasidium floriforme]
MFAATIGPSGSRVPEQQMSFSTITIMHGHIAQKSYGKEKRFLCPPPVVRMTGNISDTVETAVFKLGVRLDMLERDLDARAHLREGISFPGLYASRTGKAKGLRLRLDVFQPGGTLPREQDVDSISERPWATFEASGIQIVSKPSKQTVGITKPSKNSKAIGIRIGDPFALWSRVSAQTVMTRYLYVDIDRGLLVGRNGDWSAWVMDVVRRGEAPPGHPRDTVQDPEILTYGSIVVLRDIQTQYRTEPLLLCKVINGAVYLHDYGPVSELHRIAFAKTVPGQGRWYLQTSSRIDLDQAEEKPGLSPALYSAPQIKLEAGESGFEQREFLDDYLTWTISGITEHSFTFFEGRHEIGDYSTVFKYPLTPMPDILEVPVYNDRDNTITMAVTNYFYDDDNILYRDKPLYLYLGAIGPLRVRTYQSIAPEDNWSLVDKEPHRFPAIASDGGPDGSPETRPYSAVPRNVEHTVLVISCPDPLDMWNATQIERERYERKAQIEMLSHSALAAEDGVDDHVHLPDLPPYNKSKQLGGSSLPLLFLRQSDNTGYHTSKNLIVNRTETAHGSTWGEWTGGVFVGFTLTQDSCRHPDPVNSKHDDSLTKYDDTLDDLNSYFTAGMRYQPLSKAAQRLCHLYTILCQHYRRSGIASRLD